jgi:hypothetical protein
MLISFAQESISNLALSEQETDCFLSSSRYITTLETMHSHFMSWINTQKFTRFLDATAIVDRYQMAKHILVSRGLAKKHNSTIGVLQTSFSKDVHAILPQSSNQKYRKNKNKYRMHAHSFIVLFVFDFDLDSGPDPESFSDTGSHLPPAILCDSWAGIHPFYCRELAVDNW